MKYCSECGATVVHKIPDGDTQLRFVCNNCGIIHYQNPKIIAGCLAEYEDKILMCRRAIEPRYGLWTLPAGFMENGESLEEGAMRETFEEANARVERLKLFSLFSIPFVSHVYIMFRCKLSDLNFSAGIESLEVKLFSKDEIPWDNLAFYIIKKTLNDFYNDKELGKFSLHIDSVSQKLAHKK
jgi:ADP-ribose pyrophosphatase YjhB (NUDIX family)